MPDPNPTDPPKTDPPAGDPPKTDPPKTDPPSTDPPKTDPPATDPPSTDPPLGPAGEKALAAERDARKALEKQVAALAPLQKLAEALGVDPAKADDKSELEKLAARVTSTEETLTTERTGRWRAEVANEKGLTAEQATRLTGSTKEELLADADTLLAAFPAAKPGTPKPDPSQGGQGGSPVSLDTQIAEAQKAGDYKKVIHLQNQKLAEAK